MSEKELISMAEVLGYLRGVCMKRDTGAFFIATEAGHWAEIVVDKGDIIGVRFRNKKGLEAVQAVAVVKRAKYSFSPANDVNIYRLSLAGDPMPETEDLLQMMMEPGGPTQQEWAEATGFVEQAAVATQVAAPAAARAPAATAPAAGAAAARARATPAPAPAKAAPVPRPPGRKVLVVEDSAISRTVINRTLSSKGFNIVEAEDGFQALAQLTNEMPDLVLLDLIMPGMDGYKVLAHMKKKPEFADIPVIILTSRDTLFDKLRGKMSGSDEYLTKPFSAQELIDKVHQYLE